MEEILSRLSAPAPKPPCPSVGSLLIILNPIVFFFFYPTDGHGGFGAGALSLDNISPVFVDVEEKEAFVDKGLLLFCRW
jgi:hypothetical protein